MIAHRMHTTPESMMELALFQENTSAQNQNRPRSLADELATFDQFGQRSRQFSASFQTFSDEAISIPIFVNEFWTARQRAANSLHEISYRACFKPQLPRFFIERLTATGDCVYDPFMGRGTTALEAALLGRVPLGCDVNPLSAVLTQPRLRPPFLDEIAQRLQQINFDDAGDRPEDLLVFYHAETLQRISALKRYFVEKQGCLDAVDQWIRLLALNRLTGHSPGFFSVYTMPPNQAVSVKSQRKINERRNQYPPRRNVPAIILKKSRQLLQDCTAQERQRLGIVADQAVFLTKSCDSTPEIASGSVSLVVTSPPFLNVVDYAGDNWLRCWFLGIDPESVKLTVPKKLSEWQERMTKVFAELFRVLKKGGHIAFEVGEVHGGKTRLEEAVVPCGVAAGLEPMLVMINDQKFTKTANCWGVDNNSKGTNTNRIVVFRKPG